MISSTLRAINISESSQEEDVTERQFYINAKPGTKSGLNDFDDQNYESHSKKFS